MLARNSGGECGSTDSSLQRELGPALDPPDERPVREEPLAAGEPVDQLGARRRRG